MLLYEVLVVDRTDTVFNPALDIGSRLDVVNILIHTFSHYVTVRPQDVTQH